MSPSATWLFNLSEGGQAISHAGRARFTRNVPGGATTKLPRQPLDARKDFDDTFRAAGYSITMGTAL